MREAVSDIGASAEDAKPVVGRETEGEVVLLRTGDLFAITVPLVFGLAILSNASRVHDWLPTSAALLGVALGGFGVRYWATRSKKALPQLAGNFYIILTIWVVYSRLNALIDLLSPVPYDRDLQAIDQFLFGAQPSVWLEQFHAPWLTELLFPCYMLFFFWQFMLGVILYRRHNDEFGHYMTTVVMFYMLSYVSYVVVPAIGPRFDLAASYQTPLTGYVVAEPIRQAFYGIPMLRDCFPSGHTGLTLLVLFHAYQKRVFPFFHIMFPFGMLLIFSTLYCRFHYAVDLLCALPFVASIIILQHAFDSLLPNGLPVPLSRRASRVRVWD